MKLERITHGPVPWFDLQVVINYPPSSRAKAAFAARTWLLLRRSNTRASDDSRVRPPRGPKRAKHALEPHHQTAPVRPESSAGLYNTNVVASGGADRVSLPGGSLAARPHSLFVKGRPLCAARRQGGRIDESYGSEPLQGSHTSLSARHGTRQLHNWDRVRMPFLRATSGFRVGCGSYLTNEHREHGYGCCHLNPLTSQHYVRSRDNLACGKTW